jgi:hypothetical protein
MFYFNLMIMTLLLPFQTLLKEKEVTEDVCVKAAPKDHTDRAIDLEAVKIASDNLLTFDGLDAAETILREVYRRC